MVTSFITLFESPTFQKALHFFLSASWVWVPALLGTIFFQTWIRYARYNYIKEQGSLLLELKLPKDISKSPAAMEVIFGVLSQPSVGSYIDVYLKGRIRPWFSLELVSLGGYVHFYIWTQKKWKNLIEAQIYSQFPTVEIREVEDYAMQMTSDPEVNSLWGMQLALTKADAYPIKTYIEYGLEDDPKEEFKIDPITPLLEFLGSLKPNDQVWIQILIQAHKKENLKDLRIREVPTWKKAAEAQIKKIIKDETLASPEEGKTPSMRDLSDVQKEVIKSMQRNLSKPAFETMIRAIYIAPKEDFSGGVIGSLTSSFKQFGSETLNGFRPDFTTSFDYPWQDFKGSRLTQRKKDIHDAYRRRSFFYPPYKHYEGKPFILTTEELATLFHFPGQVASTPTLDRTPSRKAEPPSNLPV